MKGGVSPFATLAATAATAAISEHLRLRTYVVNTGLWNPAFLAREAATLDQLSQGRLELGLGAGNARSEFEAVGVTWQGAEARIEQRRDSLIEVRRRLDSAAEGRRTPGGPVPILIGAMSRAGLAVAVEYADIIAFSGLRHKAGHPPGTLRGVTAEVERRRDRWGFTSLTTFAQSSEALAAVMYELR